VLVNVSLWDEQPPQWQVLSHVDCASECQLVGRTAYTVVGSEPCWLC